MADAARIAIESEDAGGASISHTTVSPAPTAPPPATSGRKDYDQLVSFRGMKPGEPYFLLKGHDLVAADVVRDYAIRIRAAGADVAIVESALQLADLIDAYPEKRLVDADHLSDPEARQLRYRFSRRAQLRAADAVYSETVMLAEERAAQSTVSRLRPALQALFGGGAWRDDGFFVFDPSSRRRGESKEGLKPIPCPIEDLRAYLASNGRAPPRRRTRDATEAAARAMAARECRMPWPALLPATRRKWRRLALTALAAAQEAA